MSHRCGQSGKRVPDALQVPLAAILEHGGQHYCLIPNGNSWHIREVTVGPANDCFVVIHNGIENGQ